MSIPRLHLISDRRLCPLDRFPDVARQVVEGGVDAVHLREKDLPAGKLLAAARELQRAVGDRATILINDRVDIALAAGIPAVQLGEASLPTAEVRAICGDRLLIGRSVHDPAGARRAAAEGADFVIAGHIFETRSKPGLATRGLTLLETIVRCCPLPVTAVGGITSQRVPAVLDAGAYGVAVISGILGAPDPAMAARDYQQAFIMRGLT